MSKKRKGEKPAEEEAYKPPPKLSNPQLAKGLQGLKQSVAAEEAARKERAEKERAAKWGDAAKKPTATPAPVTPAAKRSTAGARGKDVDVWRPDMDEALFRVAMSGVVPLAKEGGANRAQTPTRSGGSAPKDKTSTNMRRASAEGDETIPVRWREDGGCEAARKGRSFALAMLGRFATPQETLDLHGKDPAEARSAVAEFVRSRRARGLRTVCVVHGQGRHSPDGESLLRDAVVRGLAEPPGSREVDAFQSAEASHGGVGAILIALRV